MQLATRGDAKLGEHLAQGLFGADTSRQAQADVGMHPGALGGGLNFGRESDCYQIIKAAGSCRMRLGGEQFTLGALAPASAR